MRNVMTSTERAPVEGKRALEPALKTASQGPDLCSQVEPDMATTMALLGKESPDFPATFYRLVKKDLFDRYKEKQHVRYEEKGVIKEGDIPMDCDDGEYAESYSGIVEDLFEAHP